MNKVLIFFIILVMLGCNGQSEKDTIYFDKEFNWEIKLPKEYNKLSNSEWIAKVKTGGEAMKKNNDVEFKNQSKPIFIFKINSQNYFESTKTPYNIEKNGLLKDYLKEYNEIQYNTIITERADLKITAISTNIKIDNLIFEKHAMNFLDYNTNKTVIKVISYDRLFNDKLFTVNIIYNDENIGSKMITEMENSKFK